MGPDDDRGDEGGGSGGGRRCRSDNDNNNNSRVDYAAAQRLLGDNASLDDILSCVYTLPSIEYMTMAEADALHASMDVTYDVDDDDDDRSVKRRVKFAGAAQRLKRRVLNRLRSGRIVTVVRGNGHLLHEEAEYAHLGRNRDAKTA